MEMVQSKAVYPHVEKKKVVLIVSVIVALTGIGLAAWFWKWNVTQFGGMAFLTASLIAWGISVDGKKNKEKTEQLEKKERKADRRSVRKMKKMEHQEPVRKKTVSEPVISQRQEGIQWKEVIPAQESARKQEVLQKLEFVKAEENNDVRETVGATVLLRAGEEYVPHLSLISMNPRERNSVVLLNESYTVGKLKNKVDIYIDHPSISRIHARICKEGKEYFLYDLNSTNGTFVNGRRLSVNERVQIQLSDEIRFADLGYYVGKC